MTTVRIQTTNGLGCLPMPLFRRSIRCAIGSLSRSIHLPKNPPLFCAYAGSAYSAGSSAYGRATAERMETRLDLFVEYRATQLRY
jgi:hypothetical protein